MNLWKCSGCSDKCIVYCKKAPYSCLSMIKFNPRWKSIQRFTVKNGKYGDYFYDNVLEKNVTLREVNNILNQIKIEEKKPK